MDTRANPTVSLIAPAHNEAGNITLLFERIVETFADSGFSCQVVFVDDGSSDSTYGEMREVATRADLPCAVTVLSFSRNFGKEAAMLAGLRSATGDYIGFIDADLQQDPVDFLEMCKLLQLNPEYDCVAAFQANRKRGFRERMSDRFYGFFARTSHLDVVDGASDFRVFTRKVCEALLAMPEYHRFSKGLFAWVGFKTLPYEYTPGERANGETNWSTRGLVRYAAEGIMSFSSFPLRLATYIGSVVSVAAIVYLIYEIIKHFVSGVDVPGFTTIVVLILFFGGLQLFFLGIIGEYLARTYIQGKQRPSYVIRDRIDSE
ncbi:MAG: glycosyltransferase family 2 protein [Coriobacteriales bacterium]|jgi:glycosyltransferase involved in cell wall biosynthesis